MDETLTDREALEAFVSRNADLERLEILLGEFNIFEALGAVRVELRHSDFLAFLLDPRQNHGLGDAFVKRFLKAVITESSDSPISVVDIDVWDLDHITALREWQGVDILLVDEVNPLVVLIENKIDAAEHGDQLDRYYKAVQRHYPDKTILPLFLTPEGDRPSDKRFLPISYRQVVAVVDTLLQQRSSILGPDVRTLLMHYVQMLRRHIVRESEIAELCRRIYRRHKRALDLIFEFRPDLQQAIRALLETLVEETDGLLLAHSTKTFIRFLPKEWDVPANKGDSREWDPQARILLFEFQNSANSLKLKLVAGPGKPELSRQLFELASHTRPLRTFYREMNSKFNSLFSRDFLVASDYENATMETLEAKVRKKWAHFLQTDLLKIKDILREQVWPSYDGSE